VPTSGSGPSALLPQEAPASPLIRDLAGRFRHYSARQFGDFKRAIEAQDKASGGQALQPILMHLTTPSLSSSEIVGGGPRDELLMLLVEVPTWLQASRTIAASLSLPKPSDSQCL
jgi:hypothetical protein